jgi:CheY-like chemotaxis protein
MTSLNSRPLKILMVEDHEDTLLYLTKHLEQLGHQVTIARTAAESEAAARKETHDVLLCDIGLRGKDGWSLLVEMGDARPPLCIAMSGYGMAEDVQRSQQAGFDHHLTKPFLPSDLESLLSGG